MKKAILTISILLAAAALGAGSFWGGMTYQANKAEQAQANFFATRGQGPNSGMPSGQFPDGGQFPNTGQAPGGRQGTVFGGGTIGQIKSIEGDVIELSTAQDVTIINLTADTVIKQTVTASLADLEPGMRVTVIGEEDKEGAITAAQIQVVDEAMIIERSAPPGTPMAP